MQKISFWFLSLFLFLLPWQTRWIWQQGKINGVPWEYGTFSIYATEILLWIMMMLLIMDFFLKKEFCKIKLLNCHIVKLLAGSILFLMFFVVVIWHSISWEISYQYIFHVLEGLAVFSLFVILSNSTVIPARLDSRQARQAKAGIQVSEQPLDLPTKSGSVMTNGFQMTVALWLGGVVQGVFALWQFLSQNISANKWLGLASHAPEDLGASVVEFDGERWMRAYGSFGSPNSLGIYLAVCLVVGLILYLRLSTRIRCLPLFEGEIKRGCSSSATIHQGQHPTTPPSPRRGEEKWRIFISVGQIFITIGLVLSFSRSAWLAAVCGLCSLLIAAVLSSRAKSTACRLKLQRWRGDPLKSVYKGISPLDHVSVEMTGMKSFNLIDFLKQLIIISAPIICLFIIFQPIFLARFKAENRLEYKSVYERVGQYPEFKRIFVEHPLLGAGPGVYTLALSMINPVADAYELQPVHNIYLLTLAEWGIVGSVFWLIIYVFIIREIWKKNKVWIAAVMILLVAGLFDHWNYTLYSGMMLSWTIIAFGLRGESGRN